MFTFFQDSLNLEVHGFFIHLFLISDLYFVFIIYQVVTASFDDQRHRVIENDKVNSLIQRCNSLNAASATDIDTKLWSIQIIRDTFWHFYAPPYQKLA